MDMNMARSTSIRHGYMPRRRHTSLSGFFSKILPSHRPEQGGTARDHDITGDSEAAYLDLGINPNDLTEWNLAQTQSSMPDDTKASSEGHHRASSWTAQHERRELDHRPGPSARAPGEAPNVELAQPPEGRSPNPPPHRSQHQQTHSLTRHEVSAMLKAKEDARRQRLNLKASGDWLGVQGADPYSGEFAVLTPTSTISTDSTPPSTKERLAELTWRQATAKIAYERAKLEAERARERNLLKKGRLRLQKMEQAKDRLRRQQQRQEFPTWTQHEQVWSSTAEPDLGTVPQTMNKREAGSAEAAAVATGHTGQAKAADISGNPPTKMNTRRGRKNRSTETIVRTSPPNTEFPNTSMRNTTNTYPPGFATDDDALHQEQKSEKHFLWRRRRRMTDGMMEKDQTSSIIHPSAGREESPMSDPIEPPLPVPHLPPWQELRNHFPDLLIPDHRLHLVPYPDQTENMEKYVIQSERDHSSTLWEQPARSGQRNIRNEPILRVTTNNSSSPESQINLRKDVSDAKEVLAISPPPKPKGARPLPQFQRIIPARSSSFRARQAQVLPQTRELGQTRAQTRGHTDTSLPEYTLYPMDMQQQSTLETPTIQPEEILSGQTRDNLNERPKRGLAKSASTLTITITGFDPDHQHLRDESQLHIGGLKDWNPNAETESNDTALVVPDAQGGERVLYGASITEQQRGLTASSRPIMPQSGSGNFVLARKTHENDTMSTNPVPWDADSTLPARHLQAQVPHQSRHSALMKRVLEKLEEVGIAVCPPQQYDGNPLQKTPLKELSINEAGLPYQGGNRFQVTHQHQARREHMDTMMHEAARIATLGRRVTDISTTESRAPSRRTRDCQAALPGHEMTIQKSGRASSNGVKVGFPFARSGSMDLQPPSQSALQAQQGIELGQVKEQEAPENWIGIDGDSEMNRDYDGNPPGTVVTLVSLVITTYMFVYGVASAWWVVVRPAFELRGELWTRRRLKQSTWGDIGVIIAACGFCVVVAALLGWGIRTGRWVALQL
ncbi:hypothetical protein GGS21DRAFT_90286 [Xylaria nigripes]|nr:hypothetical protein GGS21DRAFT_90286 [Xylaria nigripes]